MCKILKKNQQTNQDCYFLAHFAYNSPYRNQSVFDGSIVDDPSESDFDREENDTELESISTSTFNLQRIENIKKMGKRGSRSRSHSKEAKDAYSGKICFFNFFFLCFG